MHLNAHKCQSDVYCQPNSLHKTDVCPGRSFVPRTKPTNLMSGICIALGLLRTLGAPVSLAMPQFTLKITLPVGFGNERARTHFSAVQRSVQQLQPNSRLASNGILCFSRQSMQDINDPTCTKRFIVAHIKMRATIHFIWTEECPFWNSLLTGNSLRCLSILKPSGSERFFLLLSSAHLSGVLRHRHASNGERDGRYSTTN